MGYLQYLTRVFRRIFTSPFDKADLIAGIIGAASGIIAFWKPNLASFLGLISGAAFFGVLAGVLIYRSIFSPYWVYRDERQKRLEADRNAAAIRDSLPRLTIDQIRSAPMHIESPVQSGKRRTYHVTQVWFKNVPEFPSSSSVAENVTAVVEFWDSEETEVIHKIHGQWAISTAPNHVGYSGISATMDIPPGSLYGKLFVVLKHETDGDSYGYSQESLQRTGDGRDAAVRLEQGTYRVHITLEGLRVRSEYWLTLVNPGPDAHIELRPD